MVVIVRMKLSAKTDEATGFFALGSGPARALSRVEDLYKELGYVDHHDAGALVIEGDNAPPSSVARNVATACGIAPAKLTVLYYVDVRDALVKALVD